MPDVLEPPAKPTTPGPEAKTDDAPATPPKQDTGESWVAKRYQSLAAEKSSRLPAAKPDADKPAGEAAEKEKPKPAVKAKTPKPVPPVQPQPDYEAMGERIAQGLVKGGIGQQPAKEVPTTDRTTGLRFTERRDYEVIKKMEESGTAPKGRAEKYLDDLPLHEKREQDWLAANPDGEYDPNAPENKAFNKAHSLEDIDSDDFEAAQEELREERLAKRLKKEFDPEIEPLRIDKRLRSEAPQITDARVAAARTFFEFMGDEFTQHLEPDGRMLFSGADKLAKADPANIPAINTAHKVAVFAEQFYRLARPESEQLPPLEKPKERGAPYVSPKEAEDFAVECEAAYKALPPNIPESEDGSLDNEGRRFATHEEYASMSPSQQARHWKMYPAKIISLYARAQAELAKRNKIERQSELEAFAKASGYVKNGEQPPSNPPPEYKPKTPSPPGTIAPNAAPEMTRSAAPNGSENIGWLGSLYGRK